MVRCYTTLEQSKKLIELGLNPKSADMAYPYGQKYPIVKHSDEFFNKGMFNIFSLFYPCWSVVALINLMPKIEYENYPKSYPTFNHYNGYQFDHYCHATQYHENLIDAAFDMVCWLLENGYIKKE